MGAVLCLSNLTWNDRPTSRLLPGDNGSVRRLWIENEDTNRRGLFGFCTVSDGIGLGPSHSSSVVVEEAEALFGRADLAPIQYMTKSTWIKHTTPRVSAGNQSN